MLLFHSQVNKNKLIGFLLFVPIQALASGNDIFEWFFIELVVALVFVLSLIFLKLTLTGKILLTGIFVATEIALEALIGNTPYSDNKLTINAISLIVPLGIIYLSYIILKKWFMKIDKH